MEIAIFVYNYSIALFVGIFMIGVVFSLCQYGQLTEINRLSSIQTIFEAWPDVVWRTGSASRILSR